MLNNKNYKVQKKKRPFPLWKIHKIEKRRMFLTWGSGQFIKFIDQKTKDGKNEEGLDFRNLIGDNV